MSTLRPGAEHIGVHALVAVKDLARAKTRLSAEFSAPDRERLVLAMLADTLYAAREVSAIASITVVTPDDAVADLALDAGADVFPEPHANSGRTDDLLNSALTHAAAHLRAAVGPVDLLALQADLPALRPAELDAAVASTPLGRSIVVDHRDTGTAALFHRDPESDLDPQFGGASGRRHIATGAVALAGEWPGLRLDVDTSDDLRRAVALGVGAATTKTLDHIGWN